MVLNDYEIRVVDFDIGACCQMTHTGPLSTCANINTASGEKKVYCTYMCMGHQPSGRGENPHQYASLPSSRARRPNQQTATAMGWFRTETKDNGNGYNRQCGEQDAFNLDDGKGLTSPTRRCRITQTTRKPGGQSDDRDSLLKQQTTTRHRDVSQVLLLIAFSPNFHYVGESDFVWRGGLYLWRVISSYKRAAAGFSYLFDSVKLEKQERTG